MSIFKSTEKDNIFAKGILELIFSELLVIERLWSLDKINDNNFKIEANFENIKIVRNSIEQLKEYENKACTNCSANYKTCSIFKGANNNICLLPDSFYCSIFTKNKDIK